MSKGSNPRPVDATKYRENWERIFQPRTPETKQEPQPARTEET